jgi:uncharacterized membrane protein
MIVEMKLSRKQKILIATALLLMILAPFTVIYGPVIFGYPGYAPSLKNVAISILAFPFFGNVTGMFIVWAVYLISFILILIALLPKHKKIKKTKKPPRSS